MTSDQPNRVVLFDLDNTLFDHYHSLRSAISAVRSQYADLAERKVEDLVAQYSAALEQAYDKYLSKEITYEDTDPIKVRLFFAGLGLAEPSDEEIRRFRDIYKPAYRSNRRATPGSVEALIRLRESGYRLAIISNGQIEEQTAKAAAIGLQHLVDRIITSEEVGCPKPDRRIFDFAVKALGASPLTSHMVGDSVESDIKGSLVVGLKAYLYSPMAKYAELSLFGRKVPVIRHMEQFLAHLNIANPRFEPTLTSSPGVLVIDGIGIDLITEPRHCLDMTRQTALSHAREIGTVLRDVSGTHFDRAMARLENMIQTIANAATPIDQSKIHISYPGQGRFGVQTDASPECQITERPSSLCAEYVHLVLNVAPEIESDVRAIATLLQSHCTNLMRDYPRAAIRDLRSAMLIVADAAGVKNKTILTGEKIDE